MPSTLTTGEPFVLRDGIHTPPVPVAHRDEDYDSRGFELLRAMQERHFWYRGRHRYLLRAVHHHLGRAGDGTAPRHLIDLGGGCGGWLSYCLPRLGFPIAAAALGDSSMTALRWARDCLPAAVRCYQLDLLDLPWESRWDTIFLLDVLEHLPQQEAALRQIHRALRPGGTLFLTTPALGLFWSWVDEANGHQRRYSRRDYRRLAAAAGFELLDARYFMFFLSPLYLASRLVSRRTAKEQSPADVRQRLEKLHRLPPRLINTFLTSIFACETPLGHYVPFPWGTSLLGVFRKPMGSPPRQQGQG